MSVRYSRYLPIISLTGDFILLNIFFVLGFYLWGGVHNYSSQNHIIFYAYLNLSWLVLAIIFKAGNIEHSLPKKKMVFTYIKIIVFFFFVFLLFFQVISLSYYPRQYIGYVFVVFFTTLILWKLTLYYAFVVYRKMGYNYRNVIIVGVTNNTRALQQYFNSNYLNGYRFLGFIGPEKNEMNRIIGGWNELKIIVEEKGVDEIYIGWESVPKDVIPQITDAVNEFPIKVRIVPDFGAFSYQNAELVNYDIVPVLQIHPGPLSYWYNQFVKRVFDILFSIIIIVGALSWTSFILWVLSLFGSRQGVFFLQKRTGADGKAFKCIKFRTMDKNPEANNIQATKSDNRITPAGKFLRKTSIDELPQFINVLLGQMSVVGPRPHMLRHTGEYRKLVKRFMARHTVKPGITGLAQIRGYRGEIKKVSDIKKRIAHDVNYIETWNFWQDMKIILLTIRNLVRGEKNAY